MPSPLETPGTPFDRFRALLRTPVKPHGREFRTKCPAHDDGRPSLDFRESDQRSGDVLFTCRAGCTPRAILAALGSSFPKLLGNDDRHYYYWTRTTRKLHKDRDRGPGLRPAVKVRGQVSAWL